MSIITALAALAAFLLAIQPLPPVRFLIAAAILLGFIVFTSADEPPKHSPAARVTYPVSI
jgi:hypothetical protein